MNSCCRSLLSIRRAFAGPLYGGLQPPSEDYTGHELDDATGLHYAGARYYMSALGRWTTTDPILRANPKELLKQDARLLGMSPYNYAFANPTNLTDPTGECPVCLAAWGVIEVGLAAYDTYNAYRTATSEDATPHEKSEAIRMAAAGNVGPGGGYSLLDDALKSAKRALGFAGEVGRSAKSALQGAKLKQHYRQIEKYGEPQLLESGRIRYRGELVPAAKEGEMAGRRIVREWDPETGMKRTWFETLDQEGGVRIVRPDTKQTGGRKTHYMFDEKGNYTGSW